MARSKVTQDAIAARRNRIAANRLAGMTLAELARAEGIDKSTASRDLQAVRAEWRQQRLESMTLLQDEISRRYDVMLNAVWSRAAGGDLGAIDAVLAVERNRRKLLGLDAVHHEHVTVVSDERSTTTALDSLIAELPPEMVAALGLVARVAELAEQQHAIDHLDPLADAPPVVA